MDSLPLETFTYLMNDHVNYIFVFSVFKKKFNNILHNFNLLIFFQFFRELKDHYASTDQLIDRQYQPELLKAIVQRNPSVFKNVPGKT